MRSSFPWTHPQNHPERGSSFSSFLLFFLYPQFKTLPKLLLTKKAPSPSLREKRRTGKKRRERPSSSVFLEKEERRIDKEEEERHSRKSARCQTSHRSSHTLLATQLTNSFSQRRVFPVVAARSAPCRPTCPAIVCAPLVSLPPHDGP